MNERGIFTSKFAKDLTTAGYPVKDVEAEVLCTKNTQRASAVRTVRRWTGLSNEVIKNGIFNDTRDTVLPIIENGVRSALEPWIKTQTDEKLPEFQVVELARATELSPEKVIDALSRYPLRIAVNGAVFTSVIQLPEFPKRDVKLNESSSYGVSPKRVARDARYLSRPPGGGSVQKARIQEAKIDGLIRKDARKKAKLTFILTTPPDLEDSAVGTMKELEVKELKSSRAKSIEQVIYSEPNGKDIMTVYNYLREVGCGRNWVLGETEELLANTLISFSRGDPTDFIVWNCLAFKWSQGASGSFPICEIGDNLDTAISLYYADKLAEILQIFSGIGNPQFTVLVPSSEAFDNRLWGFSQSFQEREKVVDQAVDGLTRSLSFNPLPTNAAITVMSWNDYLSSRGAKIQPQEYSIFGENKLRESSNFNKIAKEAINSGQNYFAQNGVGDIEREMLERQQLRFYGLYAGEGIALAEIQRNGRNVVIVNFEEMRAAQLTYLGAETNLPIVTPITGKEMAGYYRWKAEKVKTRK